MLERFAGESNETSSPFRVPSAVRVPLEHETASASLHADVNRHYRPQLFCLSKM